MNDGNGMLRKLMDLGAPAHSANTRRAYDAQYRLFVQWAEKQGRWTDLAAAYPSEAVCEYLAARVERGNVSSTLQLIVCAIRARSKNAGLPDPTRNETVRRMLRDARIRGHEPRQATGLTRRDMLKIRPLATPKQWALLRLMRDCLLRRSEASAVRWRDLEREPDGTGRLTVPYSKTDQNGKGPRCSSQSAQWKPSKRFDRESFCPWARRFSGGAPGRSAGLSRVWPNRPNCEGTIQGTPHASEWCRTWRDSELC